MVGFAVGKVIGAGPEGSAELESVAVDVAAAADGCGTGALRGCGGVVPGGGFGGGGVGGSGCEFGGDCFV